MADYNLLYIKFFKKINLIHQVNFPPLPIFLLTFSFIQELLTMRSLLFATDERNCLLFKLKYF